MPFEDAPGSIVLLDRDCARAGDVQLTPLIQRGCAPADPQVSFPASRLVEQVVGWLHPFLLFPSPDGLQPIA
jgi:hypothetical protein